MTNFVLGCLIALLIRDLYMLVMVTWSNEKNIKFLKMTHLTSLILVAFFIMLHLGFIIKP